MKAVFLQCATHWPRFGGLDEPLVVDGGCVPDVNVTCNDTPQWQSVVKPIWDHCDAHGLPRPFRAPDRIGLDGWDGHNVWHMANRLLAATSDRSSDNRLPDVIYVDKEDLGAVPGIPTADEWAWWCKMLAAALNIGRLWSPKVRVCVAQVGPWIVDPSQLPDGFGANYWYSQTSSRGPANANEAKLFTPGWLASVPGEAGYVQTTAVYKAFLETEPKDWSFMLARDPPSARAHIPMLNEYLAQPSATMPPTGG